MSLNDIFIVLFFVASGEAFIKGREGNYFCVAEGIGKEFTKNGNN